MLPVVSLLFSLRRLRAPWAFSKAKAHGHPDGPAASHSCVLNLTLAGAHLLLTARTVRAPCCPRTARGEPLGLTPDSVNQSPDLEPQRCVVKAPQGF